MVSAFPRGPQSGHQHSDVNQRRTSLELIRGEDQPFQQPDYGAPEQAFELVHRLAKRELEKEIELPSDPTHGGRVSHEDARTFGNTKPIVERGVEYCWQLCPVCEAVAVPRNAKLICPHCRSIVMTCCD
jgi:hypothetical protein